MNRGVLKTDLTPVACVRKNREDSGGLKIEEQKKKKKSFQALKVTLY